VTKNYAINVYKLLKHTQHILDLGSIYKEVISFML